MKKSTILTTCFTFFFAHPMEQIDHFSIKLYGTTINVSKESLYNIADKVDICIVGRHQQQLLNYSIFTKFYYPGTQDPSDINILFYKNKNDESDSDDDICNLFEEENRSKICKNVKQKEVTSTIIKIAEPYISLDGWYRDPFTNTLMPRCCYKVMKQNVILRLFQEKTFYENQALIEASKDLAWCYENAFMKGIICKSIAFPTLSAGMGFPRDKAAPIALTAIINFLRNYAPYIYDRIELVVKKRSEFAAYKKFLIDYWQKPCLLILAHQDEDHFLHNAPREIIDFILRLMHPTTY